MNIFILDDDLENTAKYLVNSHLTKMPIENAQMLCSAIHITRLFGYSPRKVVSKECTKYNNWVKENATVRRIDQETGASMNLISHANVDCTIWARKSRENFLYLCDMNEAIEKERTFRGSKKVHESVKLTRQIRQLADLLPSKGLTPFSMTIDPPKLKEFNVVNSYRRYYNLCKRDLFDWGDRDMPDWIIGDEEANELMIKYGLNNGK